MKGAAGIMYHHKTMARALLDLYPDIGLDVNKLWERCMVFFFVFWFACVIIFLFLFLFLFLFIYLNFFYLYCIFLFIFILL
jgi:hypothetical protein